MLLNKEENNPLVSVIMPVFNCEKYVREAIESIINQTYINWELLICDDGSTDGTIKILNSFSDDRIFISRNYENEGIVATSNNLFKKIKGDYILLQDSDDKSDSNRISFLLNCFNNSDKDVGIIGSAVKMIFNHEVKDVIYPNCLDSSFIKSLESDKLPLTSASVMIKKTVFQKIGYYRTFFNRIGAADYDFFFRASIFFKIKNVDKILYIVRRNHISFTNSFSSNPLRFFSVAIAQELFRERIKHGFDTLDKNPDALTSNIFNRYSINPGTNYFIYSETLFHRSKMILALKFALIALLKYPNKKHFKNFIYILINSWR